MTLARLAIIFVATTSVAVLAAQAPFDSSLVLSRSNDERLAQGGPKEPDWKALEAETMQHYQAVLRLDTRNPPGNEVVVAEYVKGVLEKEGIPATIVGSDPKPPNLTAGQKGNGRKKPLLIRAHAHPAPPEEKKGTPPPLSATRDGGYVYGR